MVNRPAPPGSHATLCISRHTAVVNARLVWLPAGRTRRRVHAHDGYDAVTASESDTHISRRSSIIGAPP